MKNFHRFFGLIVLIGYIYFYINMDTLAPNLVTAGSTGIAKANQGVGTILILPIVTIVCFLNPSILMEKYSPRSSLWGSYFFTSGVWYLLGHVCLVTFFGLIYVFSEL